MDPTALPLGDYAPIPFPAPVWLMQILLVLGFYIHALPMNVTLMGGLTAAILIIAGRASNHAYAERTGKNLAYSLPFFTTAAITNGIVPLLFLQVVYGPAVYISSILMAVPWFSILVLLATGYYGFYLYTYKKDWLGNKAPWILILSTLLFLVIAFFFTNNMTLMLTPEKFVPMYQDSPSGLNLNWSDPTLVPRYLHFMLGAVAVTSLAVGCHGLYFRRRDPEYATWLIKRASGAFLGVTLLNLGVGAWFLFSLPAAITNRFLDLTHWASHVFWTAAGLDVVALVAMALAAAKGSFNAFKVGGVAALAIVLAMVTTRHNLRVFMLNDYINPYAHASNPQWEMLIIFAVLTVVMILYFMWLFKVTWKAFHPDESPSGS